MLGRDSGARLGREPADRVGSGWSGHAGWER